ncbi:MAG: hypothetical protein LBI60_05325 [Bacteroidales bacterium]|jgi:hypothetical protein|nr:hypothetical protein [Bacteroidales bacterium]
MPKKHIYDNKTYPAMPQLAMMPLPKKVKKIFLIFLHELIFIRISTENIPHFASEST